VAASTLLVFLDDFVTLVCCALSRPILALDPYAGGYLSAGVYDYMFVILLGTAAPVFYNLISNLLRALGDSRTPRGF
ncbi:MAG: MATE family efflux transporter, partial [Eubacteriales bacterium]